MSSFRQFLSEEDGTEELISGAEKVAQGLRNAITLTRTSWKSDSEVVSKEHARQLKKLSPEQQRKLLQIIDGYVEDFVRNLRTRPSIVPRLENRIRTAQEMIVVQTALQNLSAAAESINAEFVHRAADANIIERQEAIQMVNNVRNGATFAIGPKVLQFVADHRTVFTGALKIQQDISINIDAAAELFDRNVRAMKDELEARKKEAVMDVYYVLWALRRGLGDASIEAIQFAQRRPLAQDPPTK